MPLFKHHDDDGAHVTAVDEEGQPESPAKAGAEKKRRKQLTYAGLGLGAVGVVVTVYAIRRNSSAPASSAADVYGTGQLATGAGVPGTGSTAGGTSNTDFTQWDTLEQQLQANNAAQLAATNALSKSVARLVAELHSTAGAGAGDHSQLPKLTSSDYAQSLPASTKFDILGTDNTAGKYSGANVRGGAPVYALERIKGAWTWVQGVSPSKAPAGTIFGTPSSFRGYEVGTPYATNHTGVFAFPVANPPHASATPAH